ncbi:MAG: DEAD/DEAH box helicase [Ktedonobacterales bacterium]
MAKGGRERSPYRQHRQSNARGMSGSGGTSKRTRDATERHGRPARGGQRFEGETREPTQARWLEPPRAEPTTFSADALVQVEQFAEAEPFPLDPFQIESARHLADGRSVLVAAPTGTGKTVVAEFAIWRARNAGMRAIYTAPLKALSNQKYRDFRARYGPDEVGLLTGDIVENPRAPIVIMTTEIYRNMLLEGLRAAQVSVEDEAEALIQPVRERAALDDDALAADDVVALARQTALDEELSTVGCVIFDELHYLSDPGRGPVWEEAIIHSPTHVTFVGLSATVSNADELRRWIEHVHGPMSLVFHTERSVPLEHYFDLDGQLHLVQDAEGRRVETFPNVGGEAKLARMRNRQRRYSYYDEEDEEGEGIPGLGDAMRTLKKRERADQADGARGRGNGAVSSGAAPAGASTSAGTGGAEQSAAAEEAEEPKERQAPEPGEVLTALREASLLPCIYFLPGRRAVEVAAESAKGHLLVTPERRALLHEEVQRWVQALPPEDQKLDQVQRLATLLPRGLAFHHAGLLPGLKVMVESLFQRGELRAVFATDTLALGINMPARSVVLGSMSKFDGVQMRLLTPNEYQQLTGRAGRRGMDAKGAAILLYSPWDPFEPSFAALTAPLLPVTSAFTVRYNTVLNLWRPGDIERLRTAVAASLREFQRRGGGMRERRVEVDVAPEGRNRAKARRREERDYQLSRAAAAELYGTVDVLRALGYIDNKSDELTVKGRLLRALFHPAGVVITELLVNGALEGLGAPELAEALSWFTFDDDRSLRNFNSLSQRLIQLRREITTVQRRVIEKESEEGLALSPMIVEGFHGVALNWHRGFSLGGLVRRIDLAEGDLLVILNQTIDLSQQVQGAVGQALDAEDLWREAGQETRYGRYLAEVRARLARLRPVLDSAWRGMMRGSVAQSRAVPSMATPVTPGVTLPSDMAEEPAPLLMAEDEDPEEVRVDRNEAGPEIVEPVDPGAPGE